VLTTLNRRKEPRRTDRPAGLLIFAPGDYPQPLRAATKPRECSRSCGSGGLLLDKKGRVLQTNLKARRYLGSRFNLKRRGGNPEATINEAVQDGLRSALMGSAEVAPLLGNHIMVPRADSRPLLLRQLSVPGGLDVVGEAIAAIVVLDMDDCPHPDEDLLRELFLLTPAEARLAKRLACGQDLASIAKDLGVTRGTVRVQLKSLFWKTATRRQGELIALLAHLSRLHVAK
jgi:DNA-binding CsgD family transcriptional regulator